MATVGGDDAAVVEYARYLGIEPHEDTAMMHIAREAVVAELPLGWEEYTDDDGNVFFFNQKEDRSMWEHPCDAHYRNLVVKRRQKIHLERPTEAAPAATDMPLESIASAVSVTGRDSLDAATTGVASDGALIEPSTEVTGMDPTAAAAAAAADTNDKKYLSAVQSPEARSWWAEHVGRKRIRTRQLIKLLAAWLVEHWAMLNKASSLDAATDADVVAANPATTREYARTLAAAMEREKGKVSADDFGAFVAGSLQDNFTPTALRSLARKLQPCRTTAVKRRQEASSAGSSVARDHFTPEKTQGLTAEMRAFEMSRDSRASAVLERQRASPAAAQYAVATVVNECRDPAATTNSAAGVGAPAVSAIHRELLAPLAGGIAAVGAKPAAVAGGGGRTRAAALGGLGGVTTMAANSGSPVRLPALESSPVPTESDDMDIVHFAGGRGSVNRLAAVTDPLGAPATVGPASINDSDSGPVLVGQGGQQWGENLAGGVGMAAGRWPARHKFSMKRMRQRSEKLQPVATDAEGGNSVSAAGAAAGRAPGMRGVKSPVDHDDTIDAETDTDIEQAW